VNFRVNPDNCPNFFIAKF